MRGVPGTQYKVHRADVVGLNSGGVASGKGFPMRAETSSYDDDNSWKLREKMISHRASNGVSI